MTRYIPFFIIALSLGACGAVDKAVDFTTEKGAKALAHGVEGQCRRALDRRKQSYAIYLAEQAKVGGQGKLLPLDCTGNDQPDF